MENPLLKRQYLVTIDEMVTRIDCTNTERDRIISLLEKLDITNGSNHKMILQTEDGQILYENCFQEKE